VYEGQLVRLRAYEPEDVETLYRWYNDPDVRAHLQMRYPLSRADETAWVEHARPVSYDGCELAVETFDGRLIGGVSLRTKGPEVRCAELGISLGDKSVWGQGYGTDAMRLTCRVGFEQMDLHRIELWVHAGNERAMAVYRKVGFTLEGTARQAFFRNGKRVDMHLMGLLATELDG
jgi:RimJ/RimL family protein N-acetyltransferase